MEDLGSFRKDYTSGVLSENAIPETPIELFQQWFYELKEKNNGSEINIMSISTIGLDGYPKNRIVLLKKFTWEGFIFYTNYQSEKGNAIAHNNKVCASFFWESLERQVIIKGAVEKIAPNLSDGYFESRPKNSKIATWASTQSNEIQSRKELEEKVLFYQEKFKNKEIHRPPHWGGYIIKPVSMEFWQGRPNRLHDRIRYKLDDSLHWKVSRLEP